MTTKVLVPQVEFRVKLIVNADGWITVECPSLPGCVSQGRSRREALGNIREAIRGWLEAEQEARRRGWNAVWERGFRSSQAAMRPRRLSIWLSNSSGSVEAT